MIPCLKKRAAVPEHRIWGACGLVTDRFIDGLALAAALLGVASASILLVFAERELTPYAAAFNRLGFATIIFLAWNIGQSFLYQLGDGTATAPARPLRAAFWMYYTHTIACLFQHLPPHPPQKKALNISEAP